MAETEEEEEDRPPGTDPPAETEEILEEETREVTEVAQVPARGARPVLQREAREKGLEEARDPGETDPAAGVEGTVSGSGEHLRRETGDSREERRTETGAGRRMIGARAGEGVRLAEGDRAEVPVPTAE